MEKNVIEQHFGRFYHKKHKILGTVPYDTVLLLKRRAKVAFPINFSVNAPFFKEVCFRNYHWCRMNLFFSHEKQGVTKRCRVSWPSYMSPNAGGGGRGFAGSQPMSTAVHRSPNKLRSNSIFNLWPGKIRGVPCSSGVTARWQARGRSGPIGAQQATAANLKRNTMTGFWIF